MRDLIQTLLQGGRVEKDGPMEGEEASLEQGSTTAGRRKTHCGRRCKGKHGRRSDGPHLPSAQESHRTARDMEFVTYCTLFSVRNSAIVTEMQIAGRAYNELVTKHLAMERGSPHIWLVR